MSETALVTDDHAMIERGPERTGRRAVGALLIVAALAHRGRTVSGVRGRSATVLLRHGRRRRRAGHGQRGRFRLRQGHQWPIISNSLCLKCQEETFKEIISSNLHRH